MLPKEWPSRMVSGPRASSVRSAWMTSVYPVTSCVGCGCPGAAANGVETPKPGRSGTMTV